MKETKKEWIQAAQATLNSYIQLNERLTPCQFCIIASYIRNIDCSGCLLYNTGDNMGCVSMRTYADVHLRTKFWKQAIPLLKSLPAKRFKGIDKFFPELWKSDKEIWNKHLKDI